MNRKTVIAYAVGPIGGGIFSIISLPILTWLFSAEDIGRLAMLQVAINFSTLLFCLGLDQAYVREYHESPNKAALFVMCTAPGFILLVAAVLAVKLIHFDLISNLLFGEHIDMYAYLVLLCLVASYLSRFLSLILRMQNRALAFSLSQLLSKGLLLAIVIAYLLSDPPYTFMMLLEAQTAALLLTLVVFGWNTRHEWRSALVPGFDFENFKHLLSYGLPLVVAGLLSWGVNSLDRVFLRSLSSYEELGIYSVAASFAASAALLSSVFNTIWAPMVFKWNANGVDFERITKIADRLMAVVSIFICLTGAFLWILQYALPEKYHTVPSIVAGCMLPPLFYTLSEVTGIGIAITKKNGYAVIVSFFSLGFGMLLGWLLIPTYGSKGAMLMMVGAFWVFFILRTEISARIWKSSERRWLHIRALVMVGYVILCSLYDFYMLGSFVIYLSLFLTGFLVYGQRHTIFPMARELFLRKNVLRP